MNIKKYIAPALGLLALTACDQEAINTNVHGVTDQALRIGGLEYGTALMNMQQEVISIGSPSLTTGPGNDLQATDLISSGNYIGYFGNNNTWSFDIESAWKFRNDRADYIFRELYTKTVQPWQDIYKLAKDSDEPQDKRTLAIANIVKVVSLLRATDAFGPIVYKEIGSGNITPTPDSQEVVYKGLLNELSESVEILKDARQPILPKYDLVYDGDAKAWVRLANSLMLRIAVRMHFKDKATASMYVAKATDPANGGLIVEASQVAKVASSSKLPLLSPYIASVNEYGETRMGATIWSYLVGYNDPRVSAMFTKSTKPGAGRNGISLYQALPPTNEFQKQQNAELEASKPRLVEQDVVYWYRASETKFLLAEAALYGMYSGASVETLYKEGIALSFEEHGVSGAAAYYAQEDALPAAYEDPNNSYGAYPSYMVAWGYKSYTDNIQKDNVAPAWDNYDTQEVKLQKIMTQKYLALYPNAVEAWTEYRRTGYPFIMAPFYKKARTNIGAQESDKIRAPERIRYSASAYSSNPNLSAVTTLLGGADEGKTKLWWVRDNRPVQQ